MQLHLERIQCLVAIPNRPAHHYLAVPLSGQLQAIQILASCHESELRLLVFLLLPNFQLEVPVKPILDIEAHAVDIS